MTRILFLLAALCGLYAVIHSLRRRRTGGITPEGGRGEMSGKLKLLPKRTWTSGATHTLQVPAPPNNTGGFVVVTASFILENDFRRRLRKLYPYKRHGKSKKRGGVWIRRKR